MCEQCLTWPIALGKPLPGFFLMRARRGGNDWKKGEWALIECNDPTFTWWDTPVKVKDSWDVPDEFADAFNCDPNTGYRLITAAKKKGYNPKNGRLAFWLWNYLADWIETATIEDTGDAFPSLEQFKPADLTIERQPLQKPESST